MKYYPTTVNDSKVFPIARGRPAPPHEVLPIMNNDEQNFPVTREQTAPPNEVLPVPIY